MTRTPNPNGIPSLSPGLAVRAGRARNDYPGSPSKKIINPVGDLCKSPVFRCGARVCDPQRLDLQGDVLRLTEPRSTFAEVSVAVVYVALEMKPSIAHSPNALHAQMTTRTAPQPCQAQKAIHTTD